ncbi:SDR family NAD(P)-dependent oxidoreductase [Microbacterium radiodurans]|uniref:SDR family oxidoreductase n=1 Tax=Microbacterium radiodurans TaxID=661398 RepID=A0A5J5ISV4_9MICO|nr:SDR family oxidoreductase [Microbacterium radiodurans]KAA9085444.1 SDR family oxidoreductase [Microbacterium radiodurans]
MKAAFDARAEVVVITGGANGIGHGLAHAIAGAGGQAVVFDITAGEAWAGPGPGSVEYVAVDVSDREAVVVAVSEVVARHGRIDGLVAGAAVQPRIAVTEMTAADWSRVLDVNLDGVVWAAQAVLPHMIAQRSGSIVVFSSGLALVGRAGAAAYAASKGALLPFAKSLAAEVAEHRVRVNVLAPGVIDTPQFRAANPTGGEREHWDRTTGVGTPDDVVGPLLFLLSDAATMTGSTLSRDRSFPRS